jgi:hypothetical protein
MAGKTGMGRVLYRTLASNNFPEVHVLGLSQGQFKTPEEYGKKNVQGLPKTPYMY